MKPASTFEMPMALPEGFRAIPLVQGDAFGPVRLAVLIGAEADEIAGRLVALRDTLEARVYLGAILDSALNIVKWIEIWVQSLDGLAGSPQACQQALSNTLLDRRWSQRFAAMQHHDPRGMIATGWELEHPQPIFLNLKQQCVINPADAAAGGSWRLCQDDALLAQHGLPKYSTSLARYLYVKERHDAHAFVPVTSDAPTSTSTRTLAEIVPGLGRDVLAFNAGGGLMMVRAYSPIGAEQFVDVLGGAQWTGLRHGRTLLQWKSAAGAPGENGETPSDVGRMFLDRHGRWGRLVEALHLKLRLLADLTSAVRDYTAETRSPLLNLSADSFQIRLGETATGLPHLWTSKVALNDPGDAVALSVSTSDLQYFVRCTNTGLSIYRPELAGHAARGRGLVRIRQVLADVGGATVVMGTMTTQERIKWGKNDLLWLRLNLGGERVDLYAHFEADEALAAGEVRFRTVPQRISQALPPLRAAEGVPIADVAFEVIAPLSSPCDLYSLAVLAVRTLLVNPTNSLPRALDEVMSLARQVAQLHDPAASLRLRVQGIFEGDRRWQESIGPQRLVHEAITATEALDLIPTDLWCAVLGAIVAMIPGMGPDSLCADLGDAPTGGIHKVLDKPLSRLNELLVRTRSLIVIDWRFNREIHAVIRRFATGLADASTAPARR